MNSPTLFAILLLASLCWLPAAAQNVAINADGTAPDANAMLDVKSTTKGLLIPRMTTAQRTAIANTTGLLVYDTDTKSFWYNDGSAWNNLAAGWGLTGNSGTVDGTNFIGTTDNAPLNFRVNSQPFGKMDFSKKNVFFGYSAGLVNTGSFNVGTGGYALYSNTTGGANVANGYKALYSNTTANTNVANGFEALQYNTTAGENVANGALALQTNTGAANVANGYSALARNTTGSYNVANGFGALLNNSTGNNNVANGGSALAANTIGNYNTAIGYKANVSANNLTNATAIGDSAIVHASNTVQIGNTEVTDVYFGNGTATLHASATITPSDVRLKTFIKPLTLGLQFIEMLQPVTYLYKNEKGNRLHSGFLAQQVEKAAQQLGTNFSGVYAPGKADKYYALSYQDFIMPLVKSVQEQQQVIEDQNKKINQLEERLEALEKKVK